MKVDVAPADSLDAPVPQRRSTLVDPFRYRDFRLLWFGLAVSNVGTWMQITALGYLVVRMAGSAAAASLDVGILGASSAIPVLLLSPLAGVVADRFPRRRVLFITNSLQIVTALVLAILTGTGRIVSWDIFTLAAIRSGTQAFDAPARQSWVPLLVPRELVASAIGLNAIAFNAPSVVGPPIAGFLIVSAGIAMSFYINAVATAAVVVALVFMRPAPPSSISRQSVWASLRDGVAFLAADQILRSVFVVLVVCAILVRPYTQLMPAYAAHVVHVDARGLGALLAASGAGAILGSLLTAIAGARARGKLWFASAVVMSLASIALGFVHGFAWAVLVLAVLGVAVLSFTTTTNVLIQTLSPDAMRGRLISVFSMVILGLIPLGSLALGSLATVFGLGPSLSLGGALAFGTVVWIWFANRRLRAA